MKKGPAILASILVTAVVGALLLAIGVNALTTPNQVQAASSSSDPAAVEAVNATTSATPEQLQARIAEYQAREKQLQQQLSQLKSQLKQANAQSQEYRQLIDALQQAGVISIDRNGTVTLNSFAPSFGGGDHDDDRGGFFGGDHE